MAAACFRTGLAGEPSPDRGTDGSGSSPATGGPPPIRGRGQARPFGAADLAAVLGTVSGRAVTAATAGFLVEEDRREVERDDGCTGAGRLLLNAEAYLRHPFSREKRAEFEFSQGWNDPEFNAT